MVRNVLVQLVVTFVAVDDVEKRPINVPQLLPLTSEEQKRYDEALTRRQMRLLLSGRLNKKESDKIKATLFNS